MDRKNILAMGFSGVVMLLLLGGCPYDSPAPLSRVEDAHIDRMLVGKWEPRKVETEGTGTIVIAPFNEHEMLVVVREAGKPEDDYYRAFTSTVDGEKFLNVQEITMSSENKAWNFVNYVVSKDELRIRLVEEGLFKGKQSALKSPYEIIKANIGNKALYDEESQVLKRVNGDSVPSQSPVAEGRAPTAH